MVTLLLPSVAVVPVKPEPIVIVLVLGYLSITTPDPPAAPAQPLPPCAPPPPPVFAVPAVGCDKALALPPVPPPPVNCSSYRRKRFCNRAAGCSWNKRVKQCVAV